MPNNSLTKEEQTLVTTIVKMLMRSSKGEQTRVMAAAFLVLCEIDKQKTAVQ